MDSANPSSEFQGLYQTGESLSKDVQEHLDSWPLENRNTGPRDLPAEVFLRIDTLRDRTHRWFNDLTVQVIPRTTFDRGYTNVLLRRLSAVIRSRKFYEEYAEPWHTGVSLNGATTGEKVLVITPNGHAP
jgi:hypothetical protein